MSRRNRLPDSLRWRAVELMSQPDAARRPNVSRSVVQRLWDQYQSEDPVSRRHVSGRPRVTTPAEDRFFSSFGPKEKKHYCDAAHCRPLCIREKNLRYYGANTPSQCRSLCKATTCVCPPQLTTEKGPLMLDKRTRFPDQRAMGFCTLHRRVQIHTGERFRASADLEGTTYQIPSIQHF
ncbi:hypothetical protein AVEN_192031-1 [Araneus ventricosus]|uniref:Uncharacterized protein n=1 Tax=Araneus ventricosus TaxID=182803 RepID=A0A4Y2B641_ARAVE|nr:hypothetical protein AVEN_192031-1 [Araneus ventricosus]